MHHFHRHFEGLRRKVTDPAEVAEVLGINKDMDVLDLGAGDGFFSKEFVKRARSVTALDVDDYYFKELNSLGIRTVKANACEEIPGTYDLIFIANVYHDLVRECKESALKNIATAARRYVAVLDFNEKRMFGPPFRVPKEEVIRDFTGLGFNLKLEKDYEFHYLLLFERVNEAKATQ